MNFENIIFKIHVPIEAGIGNTLKGFFSGLTVNKNTKIECNHYSMLGNFDTCIENQYIFTYDDYNNYIVEPFSSCRWLILKEEESLQTDLPYEYSDYNNVDLNNDKYKHLFTSKVTIDHSYDKKLIHETVYNRFMDVIKNFKFKQILYDEVETTIKKYETFSFENSIGISIRTWKAPHEHNINRKYDPEEYKKEIKNRINHNTKFIIFSFDNNDVKDEYIKYINEKYPNLEIVVYDKPEYINHLQYCIIKMLLLSKCGTFICNRISTFSELVFWFSHCNQTVKALF